MTALGKNTNFRAEFQAKTLGQKCRPGHKFSVKNVIFYFRF